MFDLIVGRVDGHGDGFGGDIITDGGGFGGGRGDYYSGDGCGVGFSGNSRRMFEEGVLCLT